MRIFTIYEMLLFPFSLLTVLAHLALFHAHLLEYVSRVLLLRPRHTMRQIAATRRGDKSPRLHCCCEKTLALSLSLRYVAQIQTSLNLCDRSQRQNSVAATMIFTCHTRRFVAATCRGDVSQRFVASCVSALKAQANQDTLLWTHCCPWCFLRCANWETFVADTKYFWTKSETYFVSRTQNLPVSATNVARAGKRENICVGNNVSATMCPQQCVLVCHQVCSIYYHHNQRLASNKSDKNKIITLFCREHNFSASR